MDFCWNSEIWKLILKTSVLKCVNNVKTFLMQFWAIQNNLNRNRIFPAIFAINFALYSRSVFARIDAIFFNSFSFAFPLLFAPNYRSILYWIPAQSFPEFPLLFALNSRSIMPWIFQLNLGLNSRSVLPCICAIFAIHFALHSNLYCPECPLRFNGIPLLFDIHFALRSRSILPWISAPFCNKIPEICLIYFGLIC